MFIECIARIIAIYRNVYTLIAVLEPLRNKKINSKHVQYAISLLLSKAKFLMTINESYFIL